MRLAIIAACVAATFAIAACGNSNKSSSSAATTSATATPTGPPGGLPVTMTDFRFQPNVIRGSGGHKLTLHLKNKGKVEHNFSVTSLHIDKDLQPGKDATVTLNLPKSGTVLFFCSYHKASHNMVGSFVVGGPNAPAPKGGGSSSSKGSGY